MVGAGWREANDCLSAQESCICNQVFGVTEGGRKPLIQISLSLQTYGHLAESNTFVNSGPSGNLLSAHLLSSSCSTAIPGPP